ncbi:ComEC/Rec2 family competence protein [Patescibacteria group bacterium]|nr:ComEC/Rec2 family competence protein [Patescibacteria group bacterium]MBU4430588.1 ComEC/Rec2 family competence protein [Patescibacteria group bacterium]MCG2702115.1 ComEC/Rec2 family competence protein [Candidatus Parcubacteria bacterium]
MKNFILFCIVVLGLGVMYRFVNKDSLMGVTRSVLPVKEAGLLNGIVLGDKDGFEYGFYKRLVDSGLLHVVVASGTNVMLISGLIIENLAYILGRKRSIVFGIFLVWNYVFLVGLEAPVLRAAILISIFYWAQLLGRKYDLWRGLGLTVFVMLMIDWEMVKSVSFWLSIMAFLGVITRQQLKQLGGQVVFISKNKYSNGIATSRLKAGFAMTLINDLLTTLWVVIWVTPILSMVFGRIGVLTPIFNALVLFLVELISLWGGLGMFVGVFVPILGKVLLYLIYPLLKYFVWVIETGASVSLNINISFNWFMLIGWYMVLFYFLIRHPERERRI